MSRILALLAVLSATPALAHDAPMGWAYPQDCCSNRDCAPLASGRVQFNGTYYVVDGENFIHWRDARQSLDEQYHGCFPRPKKLQCLFIPRPPSS